MRRRLPTIPLRPGTHGQAVAAGPMYRPLKDPRAPPKQASPALDRAMTAAVAAVRLCRAHHGWAAATDLALTRDRAVGRAELDGGQRGDRRGLTPRLITAVTRMMEGGRDQDEPNRPERPVAASAPISAQAGQVKLLLPSRGGSRLNHHQTVPAHCVRSGCGVWRRRSRRQSEPPGKRPRPPLRHSPLGIPDDRLMAQVAAPL